MRWKVPEINDTRIISKFCIFPVEIDNTVYWLENIKILQRYISYRDYSLAYEYSDMEVRHKWENEKVLD